MPMWWVRNMYFKGQLILLHLSSVHITSFHWCLVHFSYYNTSWINNTCACVNCFYCVPCKIKIVLMSMMRASTMCTNLTKFVQSNTKLADNAFQKLIHALSMIISDVWQLGFEPITITSCASLHSTYEANTLHANYILVLNMKHTLTSYAIA